MFHLAWFDYVFFGSFCLALGLTGIIVCVCRMLRVGEHVKRNTAYRKRNVIPGFGGLAVFASVWIIVLGLPEFRPLLSEQRELAWGVLLATSLMLVVGLYDDWRDVHFSFKFLFQAIAALILYQFGFRIDTVTHPFSATALPLGWLGMPATVFWFLLIINAVNLIDGLDGLAAGICIIGLGMICLMGQIELTFANLICVVLTGALLGFLPFNFYPARIFLGDTGSQMLGVFVGSVTILNAIKSPAAMALTVPIAILLVPLVNVGLIAAVRVFQGRNPFKSRAGFHFHYKLLRVGLGHREAVLVLYLVSLCFGGLALWMFDHASRPFFFWMTLTGVLMLVAVYFGLDRVKRKISA